ncbi:uncharacterized protein [Henckelia pumila]|uniref:uncharacterized protein n=1 Tax=Henckelia pumila TaxID=405737 RepID=UPI003C6DEF34
MGLVGWLRLEEGWSRATSDLGSKGSQLRVWEKRGRLVHAGPRTSRPMARLGPAGPWEGPADGGPASGGRTGLPVLNKPVQGEGLFVYLAVTPRAARSVLAQQEGLNHLPIYFVSHALKGAELNYMTQENLALALFITARKLRPYFLSHPIIVLTNSALGKIAANPDASRRLIKWITELSEYDIKFEPRTAIKAQALAEFLAETVQLEQEDHLKIFVDGSSCQTGSGVGIVIVSPWGEKTNISIRLDFRASNNEAEYEALLLGLKAARNLGVSRATLYSDS